MVKRYGRPQQKEREQRSPLEQKVGVSLIRLQLSSKLLREGLVCTLLMKWDRAGVKKNSFTRGKKTSAEFADCFNAQKAIEQAKLRV